MLGWISDLFPFNRSITGEGVRQTLYYLKEILPELKIIAVPSGTKAYDWTIPEEWVFHKLQLSDEDGKVVIDSSDSNLHVVSYSSAIDAWFDLEELEPHIYTCSNMPKAIPYVTSYYGREWGICMSYEQKLRLKPGRYHLVIDSEFVQGYMNYGELYIAGKTNKEVLLSTYICHPSMANNELSGPALATYLATILYNANPILSYRILFLPETIGSILYISSHLRELKRNLIAGFVVTCVGDDNSYSFMPSRAGDSLADRAALAALKCNHISFNHYSWLDRGSDERQYCAPGVDLPVASLMRSKYGEYSEYHTSLDDLNFVSTEGLEGAAKLYLDVLSLIDINCRPRSTVVCEPMLSKRNLYPTLSTGAVPQSQVLLDMLSYCDGNSDLVEICEKLNLPIQEAFNALHCLKGANLIDY